MRHRSEELADSSSLLPLPYPYVVPGGRFRELYYWDLFHHVGLEADGRHDLALDMHSRSTAMDMCPMAIAPTTSPALTLGDVRAGKINTVVVY